MAIRESEPIHRIANRYQIHPSQVTEWKRSLLSGAGSIFELQKSKDNEALKQKIASRSKSTIFRCKWIILKEAYDESGIP